MHTVSESSPPTHAQPWHPTARTHAYVHIYIIHVQRELPLHHGKPINLLFLPKDMEPDVPGLFPNFPEAGKGGGGNFTPG